MKQAINRRAFLKQGITAAIGGSSLMAMLASLSRIEAAESTGDYKAIVCILLDGGSDSFNMIAPTDSNYRSYKKAREDIALAKDSLLPIGTQYGMRKNMGHMHTLYAQNKLAIVANVGTLVEPVTRESVSNGSALLPAQLFAHNTQKALWMFGDARNNHSKGWAARAGDRFYPTPNPYFNVTVAGNNLMQTGGIADTISFDDAYISPNTMRSFGFGPKSGGGGLGSSYHSIYQAAQQSNHKLLNTFAMRRILKMSQHVELNGLFDNVMDFDGFNSGVHEAGKPLGDQLELVAKILSVKSNFPDNHKRQIFFVKHNGWDTHNGDNEHQVAYLSDMLGVFSDAVESMDIADRVTTFTISDFGRSLTQNGSGTDHGWGGHAYVLGGAVKGGQIYGNMPTLAKNSADSLYGTVIPSISTEQYLSPILRWFGASDTELNYIFPNRTSFADKGLWFMT